jgi:uncharacterized protein YndB with AHSA1/START domain
VTKYIIATEQSVAEQNPLLGEGVPRDPDRHHPDLRLPPELVWRAVTDPALIPKWTSTGQGGTPEGFEPVVGNRFRYVGRPVPGWDGIVRCEVLDVAAPTLLRYTWHGGGETQTPSEVTYQLTPVSTGTQFTYLHTGFTGLINRITAKLILEPVRRKMLTVGLPPVLAALHAHQDR